MFDSLSEKLDRAFKVLKGQGQVTEIKLANSSCVILTINWLGETELITFSPKAFSLTVSVNCFATL